MDSRLAANIRHMLGVDDLSPIPKSLISRIERIQVLLKPFGRPIDIQHLAVLICDWEKAEQLRTGEYEPGQSLEYEGEEVFFVRRPAGKQEGKLHVRFMNQEEGRYKVVDADKVKALEVV